MAFLKIPRGKSIFIGNFAFVCKPMRAKKNAVRNLCKILNTFEFFGRIDVKISNYISNYYYNWGCLKYQV